jgi:hypothetical protein
MQLHFEVDERLPRWDASKRGGRRANAAASAQTQFREQIADINSQLYGPSRCDAQLPGIR